MNDIEEQVIVQNQGFRIQLPLVGLTVLTAKQQLRESLNIAYFADAHVNGKVVLVSHVLRGGERLEFRKCWGIKGSGDRPYEEQEAEGLIHAYGLVKIANDVKRRNLPKDESVDLTMLMVADWAAKRFGPTDSDAEKVLAEISKLIEVMVRQCNERQLAPYRFQKDGTQWRVNYAVGDNIKTGSCGNDLGIQYYARLLAAPRQVIKSLELAGKTDKETLGLIESERQFDRMVRHDPKAIHDYKTSLESLKEKRSAANYKNDFKEVERLEEEIDELENQLLPGKKKGAKPNFKTLRLQELGKSKTELKIHKAVGTAMRRAIEMLMKNEMGEVAEFLEMSVDPDGYGFVYRPLPPEPNWLL